MSQLQEAIKAIKAGDKKTGQRLLRQVVELNPANETAWMWFAAAADEPHRKKQYLQRVLEINPYNATVKQGLNQLEGKEPKEELPRLSDIVSPSSLPQTKFVTNSGLVRIVSKAIAISSLVFPICFVLISIISDPDITGRLIFSCQSRRIFASTCYKPATWIMIGVIISSSIIAYFSAEKAFAMLQAKKWGRCIVSGIIYALFLSISLFLALAGPVILILMETFWAG